MSRLRLCHEPAGQGLWARDACFPVLGSYSRLVGGAAWRTARGWRKRGVEMAAVDWLKMKPSRHGRGIIHVPLPIRVSRPRSAERAHSLPLLSSSFACWEGSRILLSRFDSIRPGNQAHCGPRPTELTRRIMHQVVAAAQPRFHLGGCRDNVIVCGFSRPAPVA